MDPSSGNPNGSEFVTVQVKDQEQEEEGENQLPSAIRSIGSKRSSICSSSEEEVSINHIELQKDFEVESLNDFLKDLQTEEVDDKDRVQYVSSLKSVEVHDILKPIRDMHQEILKKHKLDQPRQEQSEKEDEFKEYLQTPASVVVTE